MAWKNWRGEQLVELISEGMGRAATEAAEDVLTESKKEVPLDENTLMTSGDVKPAPRGLPVAIIHYGGGPGTGHPKVPYAKRWHENSANFQRGRKSRYLADPFNRYAGPFLDKAISKYMQQIIGG